MSHTENRRMLVEVPIRVMSYDTDYMKIVSNIVYIRWFEDLRTAILDRYFPLEEMLSQNNTPILAETNIQYLKSITMANKPLGRAWVEELDKSRWMVRFEIVEGETVFCRGSQTGFYFNMDKNRPVRFPKDLLESFKGLIQPCSEETTLQQP